MDSDRAPLVSSVHLKARLDAFDDAVATCRRLGARDLGRAKHTDAYFTLGRHRLALRDSSDGADVLIGRSRTERAGPVKSQTRVQRVENPGATRAALTRQWGVKCVVEKTRRSFLWQDRVQIRLDRVASLGDFLEIEAVVDPARGAPAAFDDVARIAREFGIRDRDLVAESYATLVRHAQATPSGT